MTKVSITRRSELLLIEIWKTVKGTGVHGGNEDIRNFILEGSN